jgi:hypothetical protein
MIPIVTNLMPTKFPKTVIVAITSHGEVMLDPNPQRFHLPDQMTLTSISSVSPGVCNFLFPDSNKILIQHLHNNAPPDLKKEHIFSYANQIASLFKTIQDTDLKQKNVPIDSDYSHYKHHTNKSFLVHMYTEEALNKNFIVRRNELKSTDGYNNKINIIVPGTTICNALNIKEGDKGAKMTTQDLMGMLHARGVENVIMLDLSCSQFDTELNARGSRMIAAALRKEKLHGGSGAN